MKNLKLLFRPNSKTENVTTQQLKLWENPKSEETQIVTKQKKSNWDKTQNSSCDKTQNSNPGNSISDKTKKKIFW